MNENIDLTKILKNCPIGWTFYSTIFGDVEFQKVEVNKPLPIVVNTKADYNVYYKENGYFLENFDGECTIFPSKNQRDWSKFTAPWYKLEKQRDKDKLIQELGKYKVKYTQEVLEKYINSMSNKNDERLRKTAIAFLKDFAKQGYENALECIDWLEKQYRPKPQGKSALEAIKEEKVDNANKK